LGGFAGGEGVFIEDFFDPSSLNLRRDRPSPEAMARQARSGSQDKLSIGYCLLVFIFCFDLVGDLMIMWFRNFRVIKERISSYPDEFGFCSAQLRDFFSIGFGFLFVEY